MGFVFYSYKKAAVELPYVLLRTALRFCYVPSGPVVFPYVSCLLLTFFFSLTSSLLLSPFLCFACSASICAFLCLCTLYMLFQQLTARGVP